MTQIQTRYGQPGVYRATSITLNDGEPAALPLDASGNLLVNVNAGGTSGTQYTDGAASPAHMIGTAPVFNNAGTVAEVSNTVGLPVNVIAGSITNVGTSANLFVGQVTVNTTQVHVSAASNALSNGIIVKCPSTNTANIVVGLTGVTTTTGDIIEPGESRGYAVNNTNLLYIISPTSTTDIISYSAN